MSDDLSAAHLVSLDDALLVTLPEAMQDGGIECLIATIGDRIVATASRKVVIDTSRTRFIDSFMGRTLSAVASVAHLLGAETTMVGLRPEVAITLVELGMKLSGISTALTIEQALARQPGDSGG